jgi:hypothetical protein
VKYERIHYSQRGKKTTKARYGSYLKLKKHNGETLSVEDKKILWEVIAKEAKDERKRSRFGANPFGD